jgi:hypothetical protein
MITREGLPEVGAPGTGEAADATPEKAVLEKPAAANTAVEVAIK